MKLHTALAAFIALAAPALVHPADLGEGKELTDANCYRCHGNELYTRSERKVKSLEGLRKQVQRCELALGLSWFDDQIDSVTAHLNQGFYKFK